MPRKKYEGILAEPIKATDNDMFNSLQQRLEALYKHYGINIEAPYADYDLAMALAKAHVPGFRLQKIDMRWPDGQKRPGPFEAARDKLLLRGIEALTENGHSVKRASELWVKKNPNLGFSSSEAARQRYMTLTNDGPDRGGARANLARLKPVVSKTKA